jgi:hypothetical protein
MLSVSARAAQEEDMNNAQTGVTVTVEAIETAFDGRWGIWHSGTGRWWAARHEVPAETGAEPAEAHAAGSGGPPVMLVRADDPDQLKARIQEQESRPRESVGDAGR